MTMIYATSTVKSVVSVGLTAVRDSGMSDDIRSWSRCPDQSWFGMPISSWDAYLILGKDQFSAKTNHVCN